MKRRENIKGLRERLYKLRKAMPPHATKSEAVTFYAQKLAPRLPLEWEVLHRSHCIGPRLLEFCLTDTENEHLGVD